MTFPTHFIPNSGFVLVPNNVIISSNTTNANVFTLAGSPAGPVALVVQLNAGILVGSSGISFGAALRIENFHPASTFRLNVLAAGLILGHGGKGGNGDLCEGDPGGGQCGLSGDDGASGGFAILCQGPITIDNLGEIRGGGGAGGGGGCGANTSVFSWGGGGGGGVGDIPGAGGIGFFSAQNGSAGDSTRPIGTPGLGGNGGGANGGDGGDAGDWGAAGQDGQDGTSPGGTLPCTSPGGAGGLGGAAVSLISGTTTFITMGVISGSVS